MDNKQRIKLKLAFSLIELSVVIFVIGVLIIGVLKGSAIIRAAKLQSAQSLTTNSPVASIDALVLWMEPTLERSFDSSERLAGPISRWNDINPQSKDGYNASQTTTNRKPTYTESAINGLPALKFDGTDWMRMIISSVTSDRLEVFVVANRTASAPLTSSVVFYKTGSTADFNNLESLVVAYENANNDRLQSQRIAGLSRKLPGPGTNIPYIFSTSFDGTNNIAYYNGTALNTTASSGNFGFDNILIGARWSPENSMYIGYIAELIVFDRNLTVTERKDVTKYLSDKWGIKVQ
ncbi:MAG: hypothetical protein K0R25_1401 [Rickettsiaceae bacterium]|jgi:type II secretory pathway pseudopilin PulG|nr:hypothetical protein [Rickettsiaceae bacterium]